MPEERPLTDSERARVSARVDHFYADLAKGPVEDWAPYLAGFTADSRRIALRELVIAHMGQEWKGGKRVLIEDYVARFPELGPRERVPPLLITEEYRCRLRAGLPRGVSGYQDRFPDQFPTVRDRLLAIEQEFSVVEPPPPPPSGVTNNPLRGYEKITWLGGGAFADVWLARSPSGFEKALKIVREPIRKEAAQRELKALERVKNIRHTCLLTTEDYWIESERLHIVTELADGTLRGRLEQCQEERLTGIPPEELFGYVCDAARGLDHLHKNSITHRDVKPDNILLLSGSAKVGDFGLARQQEHLMTAQSVFAGTMAYMAPEVWGKEGGPASDQYSLAMTFAELRQGALPLKAAAYPDIMFAHIDGLLEFAPFVSEPERAVIRKALARAPAERFASCQDFMRELARPLGLSYQERRAGVGGSSPQLPALSPLSPPPPAVIETLPVGPKPKDEQRKSTAIFDWPGERTDSHKSVPVLDVKPPPAALKKWLAVGFVVVLLAMIFGMLVMIFWPSSVVTTPSTKPDDGGAGGGGGVVGGGGVGGGVVGGGGGTEPTVKPSPKPKLPPETEADAGTTVDQFGDEKFYRWIVVRLNGVPVRFRLIPPGADAEGKEIPPFYVMEQKVWNRLVAKGDDTAPAFNMTAVEAAKFAARFAAGQGRLPTPTEWDHAAGLFAHKEELTRSGVPWVNKPQPSVSRKGALTADINHNDLHDMAGNGREWTRGVLELDQPTVKVTLVDGVSFKPDSRVILRGRLYTLEKPLTFGLLKDEQKAPLTAPAGTPSKYTGFRVVIPLPE